MSTDYSRAAKRLAKDFIEIQSNPLETVYAEPFNNNLFKWFATLLAPSSSRYHGIIICLEINFPNNYPQSPPTVKCLTRIHHSHVFEDYICLDMLRTHHSSEPYSGWSSSYSCLSILLQLQAFLLEEEDFKKEFIYQDIKNSRATQIRETGHYPDALRVYPMAPHWNVERVINSGLKKRKYKGSETSEQAPLKKILFEKGDESNSSVVGIVNSTIPSINQVKILEALPNEILVNIFSYLSLIELKRVERVCKTFQSTCDCKYLTFSRELICFHSKTSFKEDTLGIGLSIGKEITTPLDFLSKTSFYDDKVSDSVWGQHINGWIPLFINNNHANFQAFKSALSSMLHGFPNLLGRKVVNLESAEPYIELLCKLMNNMIVEIMKGVTHASIKAFYGYLYFHRWLIYFVEKFPTSLDSIKNKVQNFISDEKYRTKSECPNIGEFLPKLTILGPSGFTWDSIKSAVLNETGIRNALWVLKKNSDLAKTDSDQNDYDRCQRSWEENRVSCKLIMFHVFFLRNIVEAYGDMPLSELARLYDVNFGAPPKTKSGESLEDVLQREVFKICKVSSFEEYFEYVGADSQFSTARSIANYLRDCVRKSEERGYHSKRDFNHNHSNAYGNYGRGNRYDRYDYRDIYGYNNRRY